MTASAFAPQRVRFYEYDLCIRAAVDRLSPISKHLDWDVLVGSRTCLYFINTESLGSTLWHPWKTDVRMRQGRLEERGWLSRLLPQGEFPLTVLYKQQMLWNKKLEGTRSHPYLIVSYAYISKKNIHLGF